MSVRKGDRDEGKLTENIYLSVKTGREIPTVEICDHEHWWSQNVPWKR